MSLLPSTTRSSSLMLLLILLLQVGSSFAQSSRIFQWKFSSQNGVSQSLPTCQDLPILVQSFNTSAPKPSTGVPPYFMMAMAVGATPRLYPIGSDPANLTWNVDFPPSAKLFLSVIDSNNSAGGVSTSLFTVAAGQSTNCVKNDDPNPTFKITSNVTDEMQPCDPWGLTVEGGVPPYTWTLAQLGSAVVTNVTGLAAEDELVYINRGDAGKQFVAAASDFTGRFAFGTPSVMPKGSTDVDCPGRASRTGNHTELQQHSSSGSTSKKTAIIAGVVASIGGVLLIGLGVFLFFCLRRRKQHKESRPVHHHGSSPKIEMGQPFNNFGVQPYQQPLSSGNHTVEPAPFSPYTDYNPAAPQESHLSYGGSSSADYGTAASGQPASRKLSHSSYGRPNTGAHGETRLSHAPSSSGQGSSSRFQEDEEVVIQHRDGGVVRELPPPYANHGGEGEGSSSRARPRKN